MMAETRRPLDPDVPPTLRKFLGDVAAAADCVDDAKETLKKAREDLAAREADLHAWLRELVDPQASLPGMAVTVDRTTGELVEGTPDAPVQ